MSKVGNPRESDRHTDDLNLLLCLLIPSSSPSVNSSEGAETEQRRYLLNILHREFGILDAWYVNVANGVCPASGQPLVECERCREYKQLELSAKKRRKKKAWEKTLRDSLFIQGSSERRGPHLNQLGEAALAVLVRARDLCELV